LALLALAGAVVATAPARRADARPALPVVAEEAGAGENEAERAARAADMDSPSSFAGPGAKDPAAELAADPAAGDPPAPITGVPLALSEEPTVVTTSREPLAYTDRAGTLPQIVEFTARTEGRRTLRLGILSFDYGITDWLDIGTDPPSWALAAVGSVLVPNLHLKGAFLRRGPVELAAEIAFYYAFVGHDTAPGNVLILPLTGYATYQIAPRLAVSGELAYVIAEASGAGDFNRITLGASAATRAFQVGLMGEYRINNVVLVTLRGRVQAYTGPIAFSGNNDLDPFTSVSFDGRLTAPVQHPWCIIPGIAFLWKYFRFTAGVGYGNYFVPGMDVPLEHKTVVPDFSVYVVI
jgi:hypothetical protein